MSIGNKIALGFGLSLLALLTVAGVAYQGAQQLTQTTGLLFESREQARLIEDAGLVPAA